MRPPKRLFSLLLLNISTNFKLYSHSKIIIASIIDSCIHYWTIIRLLSEYYSSHTEFTEFWAYIMMNYFIKKCILISAFTKELMHSFENLLNNLLKVNTIQPQITTLIISKARDKNTNSTICHCKNYDKYNY